MGATNGIEYLVLFAVAVICGVATTLAVRAFALRFGIVNHPNKIVATHIKPVAYLGGAAVFIAVIVAALIICKLYPNALKVSENFPVKATIAGAAGFLFLGIMDDLLTFRPLIKLISQAALAIASVALGVGMHITGIDAIDSILSIAYIIVIVNATNVTDVCDGLVGGLCAIVFLLIAVFVPAFAPLALLMSACIFGFLFFNFPPATIYLGDAGAHLLGFILAVVCMQGADLSELKLQAAGWLLLVPGVVLFEMTFLIVVRVKKGLRWYRGSPDHFSLRMQAAGFSRGQTDSIAWATNAAMVSAVCNLPYCPVYMQILIVLLLVAAFIVSWQFLLRHEVKKTG